MKVSICAIIKDENLFLKEWIDYHISIGVDDFYLCEDIGSKSHEDITKDYKNVTLIQYNSILNDCPGRQLAFYRYFVSNNPIQCDWAAIIDIDEFIYIEDNKKIGDFLEEYNNYPGLYLSWKYYSASNHITRPKGNVWDSYRDESDFEDDNGWRYKSIVNMNISPELKSVHEIGGGVNTFKMKTKRIRTFNKAYIEHYFTKSWEDWLIRHLSRGDTYPGNRKIKQFFRINPDLIERKSELIDTFDKIYNEIENPLVSKDSINFIRNYKSRKVVATSLGRLGNQMFISAASCSFAKKNNLEFCGLIGNCHNSTVLRNIPFYDNSEDFLFKQYQSFGEKLPETVTSDDNILLTGYYQDIRYIDREMSLDLFKPTEDILREINDLYPDIKNQVCINVRRGDYLLEKFKTLGFRVLSKEDIDNIISKYFPEDSILFISDDLDWCKSNFNGYRFSFADKECSDKVAIDLYLQTQCKANVISNSSFSWWGAFLNENTERVICPSPWYQKGSHFDKICGNKIIPKNWELYE